MSGRLLEKLAKEEHCFISDLNRTCDYEEIIRYLKGLDLSQYSLEQCSSAGGSGASPGGFLSFKRWFLQNKNISM